MFLTCTWLVGYPLIVLLFLLNCWADAAPKVSLFAAKVDVSADVIGTESAAPRLIEETEKTRV